MWTTVALAALTMSPAQPGGGLELSNARVTYGDLGPTRPTNKYLPGDFFFLLFDMENLKTDPNGNVNYTISMEVFDSAGKSLVKQKPVEGNELISLGGTKLPARAFLFLGVDQPAGKYNCKLTVVDKNAKAEKTITQDFEVLPKDFGLVGFTAASDSAGEAPAPLFGTVGQAVWLQFFVTGFKRDAGTKQPDIQVLITLKDAATGKEVSKPQELVVNKGVMPTDSNVPVGFRIGFSRVGKFKVEIKATDKLQPGKNSILEFPLEVIASPYTK
jgi:hypothetical protein